MNRLSGRVVIVTGAALGIGAIVRRTSEEGAKVSILDLLDAEGLTRGNI